MIPNLFCVHQVGKVGSTSLVRSLEQILPGETIYQTHVLSEAGVLAMMQAWLDHPLAPDVKLHDHIVSSIELRRRLMHPGLPVNWYLFSAVREPVARNISAFFQNLNWHWMHELPAGTRGVCERMLGTNASAAEVDDEEMAALIQDLLALFKTRYHGEKYRAWFDREVRSVFGIDVFAEPFPTEAGYRIYQAGRVRLGVFRLEDLRGVFRRGMGEWLEGSGFSVTPTHGEAFERERANDGTTKSYARLYRGFIDAFALEPRDLEAIYQSPGVRHFYTDSEIAEFSRKWSGAGEASVIGAPAGSVP